ncbi:hypothetical protein ACIRVK_42615 [Streptomyces sp. NPDC101152]|uniref:hypothetical protein n=1 Tax=Streptomyces sp. NPDC101152 TaxID=3366116 RepID=UPI0038044FF0
MRVSSIVDPARDRWWASGTLAEQAGDYIGQGRSQTHQGATSTFALRWYGDGVQYDISGKRDYPTALLPPPDGEQFVARRTYQAQGSYVPSVAGLDVFGNGRGATPHREY